MIRRLLRSLTARSARAAYGIFGGGPKEQPEQPPRSLVFNPPEVYWNQSFGTPLDSKPNGKIVVFGLPKSGNTWVQSLIADYFDLPGIEPILDINKRGVGMCHWPFRDDFVTRDDFLHAVYVVRDVRDVIVSFFHYSQTEYFLKARPEFHYHDIDSFYYEWFLSRMVTTYRWHTHSIEYAALGIPVVRYERLCKDPLGEFERVIRRWGLEVDEERVKAAVQKNSIDQLKAAGKQLNVYVPPSHFRKGGSGGYLEELPPHIILDANQRFADLLKRWGYPQAREHLSADHNVTG